VYYFVDNLASTDEYRLSVKSVKFYTHRYLIDFQNILLSYQHLDFSCDIFVR